MAVISNFTSLGMPYDFQLHASSRNTSPGLSFDTSFPIFDYSLTNANLVIGLAAYIDLPNAALEEIEQMTGYGFSPFTVILSPNVSSVTVSVSPTQGTALSDPFAINCTGGYTAFTPLSYSIGYLSSSVVVTNESNSRALASNCFWIIRKRKSQMNLLIPFLLTFRTCLINYNRNVIFNLSYYYRFPNSFSNYFIFFQVLHKCYAVV